MWVCALLLTLKPECVIRRNEFLWPDIERSVDSVFTLQWNARDSEPRSLRGCAAAYIGRLPSHTSTHRHTDTHTHTHTPVGAFKIHHILFIIFTRLLNWGQGVWACVCTYGCVSALYIQYMSVTLRPLLHIFLSSIIFISSSFRALLSLNHFRLRADLQN